MLSRWDEDVEHASAQHQSLRTPQVTGLPQDHVPLTSIPGSSHSASISVYPARMPTASLGEAGEPDTSKQGR